VVIAFPGRRRIGLRGGPPCSPRKAAGRIDALVRTPRRAGPHCGSGSGRSGSAASKLESPPRPPASPPPGRGRSCVAIRERDCRPFCRDCLSHDALLNQMAVLDRRAAPWGYNPKPSRTSAHDPHPPEGRAFPRFRCSRMPGRHYRANDGTRRGYWVALPGCRAPSDAGGPQTTTYAFAADPNRRLSRLASVSQLRPRCKPLRQGPETQRRSPKQMCTVPPPSG